MWNATKFAVWGTLMLERETWLLKIEDATSFSAHGSQISTSVLLTRKGFTCKRTLPCSNLCLGTKLAKKPSFIRHCWENDFKRAWKLKLVWACLREISSNLGFHSFWVPSALVPSWMTSCFCWRSFLEISLQTPCESEKKTFKCPFKKSKLFSLFC